MSTLRSPINWVGGKAYSAKHILSAFPEPRSYDVYVELFGGGGHILMKKPPYKHLEVYNDINGDLVNWWMQCRDNAEALEERCRSLPYSRDLYYAYHKSLFSHEEMSQLERGVRWFYILRNNFNAYLRPSPCGWSAAAKDPNHGMPHAYHSAIDLFKQVSQRFKLVTIDNRDFEYVFHQWNKPRTLFYIDPPYIDAEHYYEQPFTMEDHKRLAHLLNNTSVYVVVSYYPHPLLDQLYPTNKWRRITWETFKHSQRTKATHDVATEMLLCNYASGAQTLWDDPTTLFDTITPLTPGESQIDTEDGVA